MPDTTCRLISATPEHPMRPPPACHNLLRTVPTLASCHALTSEVWRARYPPGPVLEQLTTPTPRVPCPAQGVGPNRPAHRQGAGPSAGSPAVTLPAGRYPTCWHVQPAQPPEPTTLCRGCPCRRCGRTVADHPQPIDCARPLVLAPTPLPSAGGSRAPPTEPVSHAPAVFGCAELPPASPAHPPSGARPGGTAAGASAHPEDTYPTELPTSTRAPRCRKGVALMQTRSNQNERTAEWRPGPRPAGTLPGTPGDSGRTNWWTAQRWLPHWRPSPCGQWWPGQRVRSPASPAEVPGTANPPQHTQRQRGAGRNSCGPSQRRCCRMAGRALSTTSARCTSREASKEGNVMCPKRGTLRSVSAPASGTQTAERPPRTPARGSAGDAGGGLAGYLALSRRGLPVARLGPRQVDHLAWHQETRGLHAARTLAYDMAGDHWPLAVLLHTISTPSKR